MAHIYLSIYIYIYSRRGPEQMTSIPQGSSKEHVSYSLDSLKGGYIGDSNRGALWGPLRRDTRSLDYSSC